MNHKYSTYFIVICIVLVSGVFIVNGIEGFGTNNYLAKFTSGGVITNSRIYDDNTSMIIYSYQSVMFNSTPNMTSTTGNKSEWNFTSAGSKACINILSLNDSASHAGGVMSMCSLDWGSTSLVFGANSIKPAGGYWIFYDASSYGFLIQNQNSPYESRFVVNKTDVRSYFNLTIGTNTTNQNLRVFANDNRSKRMCLNVSQSGSVSAYAC